MTRLQDEWDQQGETSSMCTTDFRSVADLPTMKKHAVVMHPLPRRQEVDSDLDNEPQAIYWRQMKWYGIRAALILRRLIDQTLLGLKEA